MPLDHRRTEAFLATADHGSLGQASLYLNISESALSRVIKRLEADLGVALFKRHTRGMELTQFGFSLLPRARLLSSERQLALQDIAALKGGVIGTVRVGAVAAAMVTVIPPALARLTEIMPEVRVKLLEVVQEKLSIALAANEIDIAITGKLTGQVPALLLPECGFRDVFMVAAAAGHPLLARDEVAIADVVDWPWIMSTTEAVSRQRLDTLFREHGLEPPRVTIESQSIGAIKAAVAGTNGLTWLPRPLFEAEIVAGTLCPVPVAELTVDRTLRVYRRSRGFMPPEALELIRILQKQSRVAWRP